jgi:hypothetical protein
MCDGSDKIIGEAENPNLVIPAKAGTHSLQVGLRLTIGRVVNLVEIADGGHLQW